MTNLSASETRLPRPRVLRAAVAAAAAVCTIVACSPVSNSGGDTSGDNQSAGQDSFGTPATPPTRSSTAARWSWPSRPSPTSSTRRCRAASTPATSSTPCARSSTTSTRRRRSCRSSRPRCPPRAPTARTVTIPLRDGRAVRRRHAVRRRGGEGHPRARPHHRRVGAQERARARSPASTPRTPRRSSSTCKQPFAPLTAALADRAGMIISPKAAKALGDNFATAPVCVGPVQVRQAGPAELHRAGQGPELLRRGKVHLDKITYRIITDASIRAANLRSGDVAGRRLPVGAGRRRRCRRSRRCTVLQSQSLGYQGVTFNIGNADGRRQRRQARSTRPQAKDPRIRQAFELRHRPRRPGQGRLQRPQHRGLLADLARRASSRTPAAQKCTPHDPAKAKQLLSEAGVTDAVHGHDAHLQQPRQPAPRPGAAVDGQGRRLRPEDQAGGVRVAARPAGPRQLRAAAARLVRAGSTRTPTSPTSSAPAAARTSPATATRSSTPC